MLSLLVLATHQEVFIFDILALGLEAFECGLWSVLRCPDLVKVVHDVRQLSDVLYHLFDLTLENVFDTLAAHLVVANWSVESQSMQTVASHMDDVVRHYLELGDETDLGVTRYSLRDPVWRTRSLSSALLLTAARSCIYLMSLATVLKLRLAVPMEVAGRVLLEEVRQLENEEAGQTVLAPHLTPDCMLATLPVWMREPT